MALYRLQDAAQGMIGPVSLETVRSLADSGLFGPDLLVSRDGGPFLPVRALEEVFGLIAPCLAEGERPTYSGDLGVLSFFRIFHRLHTSHATGQLVLRDGVLRKEVFLESGEPSFVVSGVLRERFGEFLLDRGRITREQLAAALQVAQSAGTPIGEAFVTQGALTAAAMEAELREQQLARLADLCTWTSGRYEFLTGRRYLGKRLALGPMVADTIVRAMRGVPDRAVLARLGPHLHQLPTRRRSSLVDECLGRLSSAERRALQRVDGSQSVVELARVEGERRPMLCVLYLLWEAEALDLQPRAPG